MTHRAHRPTRRRSLRRAGGLLLTAGLIVLAVLLYDADTHTPYTGAMVAATYVLLIAGLTIVIGVERVERAETTVPVPVAPPLPPRATDWLRDPPEQDPPTQDRRVPGWVNRLAHRDTEDDR